MKLPRPAAVIASLLLALPLAACEGPVKPDAIRLRYEGRTISPPDGIFVVRSLPGGSTFPAYDPAAPVVGNPGEKRQLFFYLVNGVRDEVFIRFDSATAYVSSIVVYRADSRTGLVVSAGDPPAPSAAISDATYRRLLPTPRTDPKKPASPVDDSFLPVTLDLELPAGDWYRGDITLVFSLHGFTRETRGEIRDTLAVTIPLQRKTPVTSRPGTRPATPGLMFSRPLTQPATRP